MNDNKILVTGASGFVGSWVVKKLSERGFDVRAGVHNSYFENKFIGIKNTETVKIDILDKDSLKRAMKGVRTVYHFAASVKSNVPIGQLNKVNSEGTKNVWTCAAECGVNSALYCSSAAVYGLLSYSDKPINENIPARAIEPYGRSKLHGETKALNVSVKAGLETVIVRPVAVFGPGEHTPFGLKLRDAAVSKILLAGNFRKRSLCFVHAEDVADACIYLMSEKLPGKNIYNITYNEPVLFEDAFRAYINALDRSGRSYLRVKYLASLSAIAHKLPDFPLKLFKDKRNRFSFNLFQPGFEMIYSSEKLLNLSFKFKWNNFEDIIFSCINDKPV